MLTLLKIASKVKKIVQLFDSKILLLSLAYLLQLKIKFSVGKNITDCITDFFFNLVILFAIIFKF